MRSDNAGSWSLPNMASSREKTRSEAADVGGIAKMILAALRHAGILVPCLCAPEHEHTLREGLHITMIQSRSSTCGHSISFQLYLKRYCSTTKSGDSITQLVDKDRRQMDDSKRWIE